MVPLQTVLALVLALIVNQRLLRGRTFFRTAFYFPSVTSSVAISLVFLFLFTSTGAVNAVLGRVRHRRAGLVRRSPGAAPPRSARLGLWDIEQPTECAGGPRRPRAVLWDWLSGPSVAMSAIMMLVIWTTAGTFMLMFLAALQDMPVEVDEAAIVDGASQVAACSAT